jgi:hypothetical protein
MLRSNLKNTATEHTGNTVFEIIFITGFHLQGCFSAKSSPTVFSVPTVASYAAAQF